MPDLEHDRRDLWIFFFELISKYTLSAIANVMQCNQMLKRVQHDSASHYRNENLLCKAFLEF
jgi:hypothetical protein